MKQYSFLFETATAQASGGKSVQVGQQLGRGFNARKRLYKDGGQGLINQARKDAGIVDKPTQAPTLVQGGSRATLDQKIAMRDQRAKAKGQSTSTMSVKEWNRQHAQTSTPQQPAPKPNPAAASQTQAKPQAPAPNQTPASGGGTPPTPQQPAPTSGIGAKAGEVAGRTAQRAGGWLRNAGNRFMNSPGKMGALAGMSIGMYNAWKNGKSMLNPWTWIKGAATGAVLGKVGGAVANMGRQPRA